MRSLNTSAPAGRGAVAELANHTSAGDRTDHAVGRDRADANVALVDRVDRPIGREHDGLRLIEQRLTRRTIVAGVAVAVAPRFDDVRLGIEHANLVVVPCGNVELAVRTELGVGHVVQRDRGADRTRRRTRRQTVIHLGRTIPLVVRPDHRDECVVGLDAAYAMVVPVDDVPAVVGIERQVFGVVELAVEPVRALVLDVVAAFADAGPHTCCAGRRARIGLSSTRGQTHCDGKSG